MTGAALRERLRRAAEDSSSIAREMAEAKSMRQASSGGRTDLYMWPKPEETLEGQAAAMFDQLEDVLLRARDAMGAATDALNSGEPSRHRSAEQFLQHEMDIVRGAVATLRGDAK